MPPLTPFEQLVVEAFKQHCQAPLGGASAYDVTRLLRESGQMPADLTAVDVNRVLLDLRERKLL